MRSLRLKKLGAGTVEIDWASTDAIIVGTHWIGGKAFLCPRPWHRSKEAALRDSSCPECVARDARIRVYRAAFLNGSDVAVLIELSEEAVRRIRASGGWLHSSRVVLERRTRQSCWDVLGVTKDVNLSLEFHVGWGSLAESVRRLWQLPRTAELLRCQDEWVEAIRTRILAEHHSRPPLPLIV